MQIKSATFGQLQNNCYLVTDEASDPPFKIRVNTSRPSSSLPNR